MNARELASKFGMMSEEEVSLLQDCCHYLPSEPVCVVIGASVGTASLSILEIRPSAYLFSVDKNICLEEIENVSQAGYAARLTRILGRSQTVGLNWPFHFMINLLVIDGGHTAKDLNGDIRSWIPKVIVPGGIVVFHDYKHKNVPHITDIVDRWGKDKKRLGEARYLVVFQL